MVRLRKRLVMKRIVFLLPALFLVACGGGGGSSSQSSNGAPASNNPPQPGTDITVSLPENVIAGPLNLTAPTDSDGDTMTLVVTAIPTSGRLRKGDGQSVSVGYNIGINSNIFGPTGLNFTPDTDTNDNNSSFGYFSYSVSDGKVTVTRTISISINPTTGNCSLSVNSGPFTSTWPGLDWESADPESLGMCPDEINQAMEYAFKEGNYTGAVLVIKNGYIVSEKYADNKMPTDLVTSWSVAKSFTSSLIGIALDDGFISNIDQPVSDFITSWKATNKESITLKQLMTVRTALNLLDGSDLYNAPDQLKISLERELIGQPGEKLYDYSNSDVMLAGEVIRAATGKNAGAYLEEKVESIIRSSSEWWSDSLGNILSYCCLDATPRNFARFGLLFSRNGEWDGINVISSGWVNESTSPAISGEYGFYWWPAGNNGFTALGIQGQIVAIYPEVDLVILRFSSYTRMGDGSTIRTSSNYHSTTEPIDFNNNTFLNLIYSSIK